MRIFLAICAFSAFLSSVICQFQVRRILDGSGLTDGLFWRNEQLFFVESTLSKLCSLNTRTKALACVNLGHGLVSFAVPVEGHPDRFVVGSTKEILLIEWDGWTEAQHPTSRIRLETVDPFINNNRLNYGGVDPTGKLWFGTLNNPPGRYEHNLGNVYSMDAQRQLIRHIQHVSLSSGFVWDVVMTNPYKFYYVDSMTYQVASYIYYPESGMIDVDSREVIIDIRNHAAQGIRGLPGRLAIDNRGWLWVPLFYGSKVIEVNPHAKTLERSINIRAAKVGACTFGGPGYETLYVSTIGYGYENRDDIRPPNDQGGSLFAVRNLGFGVHGYRTVNYKLNGIHPVSPPVQTPRRRSRLVRNA